MPWLETDVREQRILFVSEATQPSTNISALCRKFGVSRRTGYRWLERYRAAGSLSALGERSRRPHHSPTRTPQRLTERIVALRREYQWAGRKLHVLLAAEGLQRSTATIDRIISREGLVDLSESHPPALTRFERAAPNELWQMDFKGQYPLPGTQWCFPWSVLDDHSRYALALRPFTGTAGPAVHQALVECFDRYGLPDAILVDHGSPWWSTSNGHGLTTFAVALLAQGIDVRHSGVRHPQTQGKIERFHRTLGRRLRQWGVPTDMPSFARALDRFREEYNEVRPHEAVDLQPPATRYRPSPRAYQATPRPWEYPVGAGVYRVDQAGCIGVSGRRYFVCHALATHVVGCRPLAEDRLLVTFRDRYIREIDLRTGQSRAMLERVR